MTLRAVVLGFLGAACIGGYTYFNDGVLRQTMFVGNYMPTSVYGGLLLVLFLLNPLLRRLPVFVGARVPWLRPFSGRELVVVVALALPTCCVPYSSMLRILPKEAMLPHHYAKTQPGWTWKDDVGVVHNAVDYAPRRMLADPTADDGNALLGFVQGLRLEGKPISEWVKTANVHDDFTIENHGAYHFCYMSCPLHNLAWSYYALRTARRSVPPQLWHHYREVWNALARTFLPDGRFAYLSGKDWPRYAYGLSFILPVTVVAGEKMWGGHQ